MQTFAPVRDAYDLSGSERNTAGPFELALATFETADRELEALGRAVNRAEDAASNADAGERWGGAGEREVEAAERRWWRQYRRAYAAALNVLRMPTNTPEAAQHKWEIIRRYFEGGDARSCKALLRSSVTSGGFTAEATACVRTCEAEADAPIERRDDASLGVARHAGPTEGELGYELHLDGEEWIILHNGVEEARYVRAEQALAHARRELLKQGKDEWCFRLGFSGR